ncbi:hypothetical protein [Fibrella aquatilis]|uniref:Uncharacterized protein n=1 Tax=Fibrella aquatilis TaxID=2817059 RepID=A0A939G6U7_9BACT|nr:hypothetical protein [Fibrella aquatilis]MBO0932941.1 hypothetical protein [Fibrella aquatilis]
MKKLSFVCLVISVFGCQHKNEEPLDVAGRASGIYNVKTYVVDGDTVFSQGGKNKPGIRAYRVEIGRKAADSVGIVTVYVRDGSSLGAGKYVAVKETNSRFQFSDRNATLTVYESYVDGTTFYERTVGYNVDSIPRPLPPNYEPPLREVRITAVKQ